MDNIKRIKVPMFKVGKYSLNIYEVRNLIMEVIKGEREPGIKITDEMGNVATILSGGFFDTDLPRFNLDGEQHIEIFKLRMLYNNHTKPQTK